MRVRTLWDELSHIHPASGTRRVAVRAAVTIGVALGSLLVVGRVDLGLYAVFGAFAAVYGGSTPFTGRWRIQVAAGLVLVGATTSGAIAAVSGHRAWVVIAVAAVWATIAAGLSDRHRWVPPGPLFAVFAVGACGARPTFWHEVPIALTIVVATATLAIVLGVVDERAAHVPREPQHGRAGFVIAPERRVVQLVRVPCAAVLAGAIATTAGVGHPYWAMVAVVVPMTVPGLRAQLGRAWHRLAGTLLGIGVAYALLSLHLPDVAAVAVAVVLQGVAELLVVRNYAAALMFITPLALLMGQLAVPQPVGPLVLDRFAETLLGTVIGVAIAVLTRDRSTTT